MYRIYRSTNPKTKVEIAGPFNTFGLAKKHLLEIYNKLDKPLPDMWALDKNGKGTSDASDVLKNIVAKAGGGIMPLGGETEQSGSHKGYGYGMFCEIFTSILSMGLTSKAVLLFV